MPLASSPLPLQLARTHAQPAETLLIVLCAHTVPTPAPALTLPATAAAGAANGTAAAARYIVFMIDPDAPTPQNPTSAQIIHWLQADLVLTTSTSSSTSNSSSSAASLAITNLTAPLIPYARPMPPTTSIAHRYIQYLFAQPPGFSVPAPAAGFSATNRSMFNIEHFVAAAGLASPLAANYMYIANMTGASVPALYSGAPVGVAPSAAATATATGAATGTAGGPAVFTGAAVRVRAQGALLAAVAGAGGLVAALSG